MAMIVFPLNWYKIGQPVTLGQLDNAIKQSLIECGCRNLSLSGGLDSSLLLYYLVEIFGTDISCYTIALNREHPDFRYSKIIVEHFGVRWKVFIPTKPLKREERDFPGDEIVREFYHLLINEGVCEIVAGDGIDELTCGYYAHERNPTEQTYYNFLTRLCKEHLEPLNKQSKGIKVKLPYLHPKVVHLLSFIPVAEKLAEGRKTIVARLAKDRISNDIVYRRKYGFVDAMCLK